MQARGVAIERVLTMIAAGVLLAASPAMAETYYLGGPGADDGNAGSSAAPWASFAHALDQLSTGDVLLVRDGTYRERVVVSTQGVQVRAEPGARPLIDGEQQRPAAASEGLVELSADSVTFEGFEVRNSAALGIDVTGNGCRIASCLVRDSEQSGIVHGYGDGGVIRDNELHGNLLANREQTLRGRAAILCDGSRQVRIEGNTVRENYGLGVGVIDSSAITVQGNRLIDNVENQVAIETSAAVSVLGNFVRCSGAAAFAIDGARAQGVDLFELADDSTAPTVVANNIVVGCAVGIYWLGGVAPVVIAHNTLVDSVSAAAFIAPGAEVTGALFANNMVVDPGQALQLELQRADAVRFASNSWVGQAPPAAAVSAGDVGVDCRLTDPSATAPEGYTITAASACHRTGTPVPQVTEDFFGNPRGQPPDIGAHEVSDATDDSGGCGCAHDPTAPGATHTALAGPGALLALLALAWLLALRRRS